LFYFTFIATVWAALRDNFNRNVSTINVYNLRHSDVIMIKLTAGTQN